MAELTAESFSPHVGTIFTLTAAEARLCLVEVEVRVGPPGMRTPFTLSFTSETQFGQGTYAVEQPEMGRFDLFLVPQQPLSDGIPRYVAVFN